MNILIAADMVPKENNNELFEEGNIKEILGSKLNSIWQNADYKIFNIEAPITECNENNKIKKCGPNLRINPKVMKGIKSLNPTCVTLANNHIMDYGKIGKDDTVKYLDNNKIDWIGIGTNRKDIRKTYIIENGLKKVGIYNCCETEFSVATEKEDGANGIDMLCIYNDINELKKICDFVTVIYHGGKEYYRYPSPYLQKVCRKIIDYGADIIICQHSHCIGCYENYSNGKIIYGQGNFVFDGPNNEFWNESLLVELKINNKIEVNYIPIVKTEYGTKLADEQKAKEIINQFNKRSEEITQKDFVEKTYKEFARTKIEDYLIYLHGNNIIFKIINKLCFHKLTKKMYSQKSLLNILNVIECEAHRELLIEGLKEEIYNERKNYE